MDASTYSDGYHSIGYSVDGGVKCLLGAEFTSHPTTGNYSIGDIPLWPSGDYPLWQSFNRPVFQAQLPHKLSYWGSTTRVTFRADSFNHGKYTRADCGTTSGFLIINLENLLLTLLRAPADYGQF